MKLEADKKGYVVSHTLEPWEKPSHSLYIHYTDQAGAVPIPQLLMGDNYTDWTQSMTMALTIKNKKGLVDGSIKRPSHNEAEQQQWDRVDMLVKAWLLASMSKEISKSVRHCGTARAMWLELKERFSHTNTVQLFQLEKAIHDCEQGTISVNTFFTKLKALWDEKDSVCAFLACTCEAAAEIRKYMETQKTMKFFMGLNNHFALIRSNVIGLDPLPELNKAYSTALRHEKQAEVSNGKAVAPVEATAFVAKKFSKGTTRSKGELRCEICNYTNHSTKNCHVHLKCTICNGQGHTQEYYRAHLKCTHYNRKGQSQETCRRKRNTKANQTGSSSNSECFPLSRTECQQMLGFFK